MPHSDEPLRIRPPGAERAAPLPGRIASLNKDQYRNAADAQEHLLAAMARQGWGSVSPDPGGLQVPLDARDVAANDLRPNTPVVFQEDGTVARPREGQAPQGVVTHIDASTGPDWRQRVRVMRLAEARQAGYEPSHPWPKDSKPIVIPRPAEGRGKRVVEQLSDDD